MEHNYQVGDIVRSGKGFFRVFAASKPQVLAIQKLSEPLGSQAGVLSTSGIGIEPVVVTDEMFTKIGAIQNQINWWELDLPGNIGYLAMNPRNGIVWLKHRGNEGVMINPKTSNKIYLHEVQRMFRGLSDQELIKDIEL